MKLFGLGVILSLSCATSAWGADNCATVGESRKKDEKYQICHNGVWTGDCSLGQISINAKVLCVTQKLQGNRDQNVLWSCDTKTSKGLKYIDAGDYECKQEGEELKWVKKDEKPDDIPPGSKKKKGDSEKSSLSDLIKTNKSSFEAINWGDTPKDVVNQLKLLAPRFHCAFRLRDSRKYGNYYSLFRGHGRQKSYDKAIAMKQDGCPNGEIPFETTWNVFTESSKRLKHFVWNLQFDAEKNKYGRDIVRNEKDNFLARWHLGWYQLKPVKRKDLDSKPVASENLAWYDKKARKMEGSLESKLGDCAVGTNCRSFSVFKYKLRNCNMRQLYDSRCLAWAQSSKWLGSIIQSYDDKKIESPNKYLRENVIYAFVTEELLNRFDRYTYNNRWVRTISPLIKKSKEFESIENIKAVIKDSSDDIDSKSIERLFSSLMAQDKPKDGSSN